MGVTLGVKASGTRTEHPTVTHSLWVRNAIPVRNSENHHVQSALKQHGWILASRVGVLEVFCPPWLNFPRQMLFSIAQT